MPDTQKVLHKHQVLILLATSPQDSGSQMYASLLTAAAPPVHWPATHMLTSTHCGDGILLANDVLLEPLLQGKAAPLLGLPLSLLLLVLWGERKGDLGVLGALVTEFHPGSKSKPKSGSPRVLMHSFGSRPLEGGPILPLSHHPSPRLISFPQVATAQRSWLTLLVSTTRLTLTFDPGV